VEGVWPVYTPELFQCLLAVWATILRGLMPHARAPSLPHLPYLTETSGNVLSHHIGRVSERTDEVIDRAAGAQQPSDLAALFRHPFLRVSRRV